MTPPRPSPAAARIGLLPTGGRGRGSSAAVCVAPAAVAVRHSSLIRLLTDDGSTCNSNSNSGGGGGALPVFPVALPLPALAALLALWAAVGDVDAAAAPEPLLDAAVSAALLGGGPSSSSSSSAAAADGRGPSAPRPRPFDPLDAVDAARAAGLLAAADYLGCGPLLHAAARYVVRAVAAADPAALLRGAVAGGVAVGPEAEAAVGEAAVGEAAAAVVVGPCAAVAGGWEGDPRLAAPWLTPAALVGLRRGGEALVRAMTTAGLS